MCTKAHAELLGNCRQMSSQCEFYSVTSYMSRGGIRCVMIFKCILVYVRSNETTFFQFVFESRVLKSSSRESVRVYRERFSGMILSSLVVCNQFFSVSSCCNHPFAN